MPAIYHEGSWLGNATDPEVLVKDTVGWIGKNLLKNTATNKTGGNVAWVVNADKSITINTSESASSVQTLYIGEVTGLQGDYILNGVTGGSMSTYGIQLYDVTTSTWITQYAVDGDSTINLADKNHTYRFVAYVRQGVSVSNITICPMLRKADITDPTYEPYHESVEEEIEQIYTDNGVLGAKNLLPRTDNGNKIVGKTENGITYIVNDDDSITISGTSTAQSQLKFFDGTLPVGKYLFNGCVGGSEQTYKIQIYPVGGSAVNIDDGEEKELTVTNPLQEYRANVTVYRGTTISTPVTLYPMLRLASDPDDTYQPYAMTNRELTEKVFEKRTLTSADNLNNIVETGIYGITSAPTNSPENTDYASLIVQKTNSTDIRQIIFKQRSAGGNIYVRASYAQDSSIAWTAWNKFTGTVVS